MFHSRLIFSLLFSQYYFLSLDHVVWIRLSSSLTTRPLTICFKQINVYGFIAVWLTRNKSHIFKMQALSLGLRHCHRNTAIVRHWIYPQPTTWPVLLCNSFSRSPSWNRAGRLLSLHFPGTPGDWQCAVARICPLAPSSSMIITSCAGVKAVLPVLQCSVKWMCQSPRPLTCVEWWDGRQGFRNCPVIFQNGCPFLHSHRLAPIADQRGTVPWSYQLE